MTGPSATGGLFQSLRRLVDTGVEIVQVRLELFGSELEREKLRLYDAVVSGRLDGSYHGQDVQPGHA